MYTAQQFAATQWSTAQDKADFANTLAQFVGSDYKKSLFTKKLYQRLSQTFGHIAHCNQAGFWETWFAGVDSQLEFERHMQTYRVCGDPAWTYSDVERVVQRDFFGKP